MILKHLSSINNEEGLVELDAPSAFEGNAPRKRYKKELKEEIVESIVTGQLWLEEALRKYKIADEQLVVKWLRKYVREKKKKARL